jgi:hypothetical protein
MSTKYVFFSDLGFGGLAEAAAQQPPLGWAPVPLLYMHQKYGV